MDLASLYLRRLNTDDVERVISFLSHNYFNCGKLDDQWEGEELAGWVNNPSDYCVGAFLDGTMIGFCLSHLHAEAHKVHLENIFVKEEYRHRGIAQKLLGEITRYYGNTNERVRFVGLVDQENIQSIHLLKGAGFTVGSTMFWMQRNIRYD